MRAYAVFVSLAINRLNLVVFIENSPKNCDAVELVYFLALKALDSISNVLRSERSP